MVGKDSRVDFRSIHVGVTFQRLFAALAVRSSRLRFTLVAGNGPGETNIRPSETCAVP